MDIFGRTPRTLEIGNLRAAVCAAVLAASLVVGAPSSTLLADDGQGGSTGVARSVVVPADIRPVLELYRDGKAGLGSPAMFLRGEVPKRTITVGDLDGDGHPDLVVAEPGGNKAWAFRADGTGRFAPPVAVAATSRQRVVAVGDFNGDGHDDQAVAEQYAAGVVLLYGDGTGAFKPASSGGPGVTVIADFDNDGHPDLAAIDSRTGELTIFLGDGSGGVNSTYTMPVELDAGILAIGDFDGDGIPDLVIGSSRSESVSILFGDGAGRIKTVKSVALELRPTAVAVGDFNGDGMLDLAATDSGTAGVAILSGDGRGGFSPPTVIAIDDRNRSPQTSAWSVPRTVPGYVGFPVVSLTLSPATIAGGSGGAATATVTLGGPAPVGGTPINLASSNTDLAASIPSVVVPAGATSATFVVATNAQYRRYSGLAFNATITATNPGDGSSAPATLAVTAQSRPGPISGDRNNFQGLMCGGTAPTLRGEYGILYNCTLPKQPGGLATCTFSQECALGCQTRQNAGTFQDMCAADQTLPVSLGPNYVVGGNVVNGALHLSTPAPVLTSALVQNDGVALLTTPIGFFPIAQGATTAPFAVNTLPVTSPTFLGIRSNIVTPLHRLALSYLAVVPAAGASAPPRPLALSAISVSPTTVVGGNDSTATVTLNGVPPSGGVAVTLSSSNPAAVVPTSVLVPAASTSAIFPVLTTSVTASTPVSITSTFGGVSKSVMLTITPAPTTATLTATATGRGGAGITSAPAGIDVAVGSTGSTVFAVNSSVTLSAGGRDAIWSGACSSSGNKQKTCTFSVMANAAVAANVQ